MPGMLNFDILIFVSRAASWNICDQRELVLVLIWLPPSLTSVSSAFVHPLVG
jgi:hypothetical protein